MRHLLPFLAALLLAAAPAAAQELDPDLTPDATVAELQQMVDQTRAQMLRPGERVAGWDRGGADPDRDLRARGAERHYMLTSHGSGQSVGILTRRPIAELAPSSWTVVDSFGTAATPLDHPQVDFQPLSARYVVATRTQFTRRGDVDCTSGIANALLYDRGEGEASMEDASVILTFRILILALEGQEICVRSEGSEAQGYTSRLFLPDGRLLPGLGDDGVTRIVDAAPLDRLVVYREPAQAPGEPNPSS
jgi:hypothetical protein